MEPRSRHLRTYLLSLAGVAGIASLLCCNSDVLHATSFDTECTRDATACQEYDYCAMDQAAARARAERVCGLVGACTGPFGENVFGACLERAILAYDCGARPNLPVRGEARAYYDCLYAASEGGGPSACDAVTRCVTPSGSAGCPESQTESVTCQPGGKRGVRVSCRNGVRAAVERCLDAQCTVDGVNASCTQAALPCKNGCSEPSDLFVTCAAAPMTGASVLLDEVDCALLGAGNCTAYGCEPVTKNDCTSAAGSDAVMCRGNTAVACIGGGEDAVDCARLGQPCNAAGALDPRAACRSTAGPCVDTCIGATLESCWNGATHTLDCAALGFDFCDLATIPGERVRRARCAKN